MTKFELVEEIALATGQDDSVVEQVIDCFIDKIKESICRGQPAFRIRHINSGSELNLVFSKKH